MYILLKLFQSESDKCFGTEGHLYLSFSQSPAHPLVLLFLVFQMQMRLLIAARSVSPLVPVRWPPRPRSRFWISLFWFSLYAFCSLLILHLPWPRSSMQIAGLVRFSGCYLNRSFFLFPYMQTSFTPFVLQPSTDQTLHYSGFCAWFIRFCRYSRLLTLPWTVPKKFDAQIPNSCGVLKFMWIYGVDSIEPIIFLLE